MQTFSLKSKQQYFIDQINNPQYDTYVLMGSVGTGKTDVAAHAVTTICQKFPGTYFPVFRLNNTTAERTTFLSYLNMLDLMGFEEGVEYTKTTKPLQINFRNGSKIPFIEADHTKDREGRKIKGVNASGSHIDEADELQFEMFLQAASRKGRRNQVGQPSITIVTMNPNNSWAKELYYDKFRKGELPPNVCVIEFTIDDSWQSPNDIRTLKDYPYAWQQRYLWNNWNYSDDDDSLFKYRDLDAAHTHVIKGGERYAALDVARKENGDRSVISLWTGQVLTDVKIIKEKNKAKRGDIQAEDFMEFCEENNVGYQNATIDITGVGWTVYDPCIKAGFKCRQFVAGGKATSIPKGSKKQQRFKDKRAEATFNLAYALQNGTAKFHHAVPFLSELKKELTAQHYNPTDKILKVESKEEVKKRLGFSPDIADSVIMGHDMVANRRSGTTKSTRPRKSVEDMYRQAMRG